MAEGRVEQQDGQTVIAEMDCNYERCLNRQDCQLVRQALENPIGTPRRQALEEAEQ